MDILTFVKTKLSDRNMAQLAEISDETHIPLPTINGIKYGKTENPRIKTIQPLLDYFNRHSAETPRTEIRRDADHSERRKSE